jgi:phosphoribosylglycinamide formyltransferase-1
MSSKRKNRNIREEFVSEPIEPVAGTFDTTSMTRGEPGLPGRFIWRDKEYAVADVLEVWKELGACKSGGPERYLRKHWFRIRTSNGMIMTIYFERQPRSKNQNKMRWWLYTIIRKENDE